MIDINPFITSIRNLDFMIQLEKRFKNFLKRDTPNDRYSEKFAIIERIVKDVKLHKIVDREPTLESMGLYPESSEEMQKSELKRSHLKINDPHAVISEVDMELTPIEIKFYSLDYATLEVLRENKKHGLIISANAVIVCPEKKLIVVHKRSKKSITYGASIHTIGGAYQPPNFRPGIDYDRYSLIATAQREVKEETNIAISCDEKPIKMLIAEELSTRFFQLIIMGARISSSQLERQSRNWESSGIILIEFDQLHSFLINPENKWVPSGKAHILVWLAMGAPGAEGALFNNKKPQALFKEIVNLLS